MNVRLVPAGWFAGVLALLVGIGSASAAAATQVAVFQADVTIPMGELLYRKPLERIEYPLMAKGIVLDDGSHRYVLCAIDWCTMCRATRQRFRHRLAEAVGTDAGRVAVQCVHQHTAPSYCSADWKLLESYEELSPERDPKFLNAVTTRVAAAARASLEKFEKVDHIGTGQARVDRVASCRRLLGTDGTIRTRWSACTDPKLRAEPEGPIDPMVKTITFACGDRPIVRLHYYATHPQSIYGEGVASYDVPGIARQRLEKEEGVFQIYFTGCAGDITMGKYNDRTQKAKAELAERLYEGMNAAAKATQLAPIGPIRWHVVDVRFAAKNPGGGELDAERKVLADPKADEGRRRRAAARLAQSQQLAEPIDLSCLEIGSVRIVHLPGEPMLEFQKYAQRTVPGAFVAVAGYGCGSTGYLCTARAFVEGGYEPSASNVVPESENLLKEGIRRVLSAESVRY